MPKAATDLDKVVQDALNETKKAAFSAIRLRPTTNASTVIDNLMNVTVARSVRTNGAGWWRKYKAYMIQHSVCIAEVSESLAKAEGSRMLRQRHICAGSSMVINWARKECQKFAAQHPAKIVMLEGCTGYRGPKSIGC